MFHHCISCNKQGGGGGGVHKTNTLNIYILYRPVILQSCEIWINFQMGTVELCHLLVLYLTAVDRHTQLLQISEC